ncbi:glycosyltransferase family 4 protein [Rhodoblastus sp.]|uniref:glycosyltransferase family 4 protein n=1 Tax=Rhodoblastus sp. TaxID=1962975 RepID=UPI00262D19DE|nr:glycosyltransferase family 4 protein [Rhodoblastus sp.]
MGARLHIVIIIDHASITGGQAKVALQSAIALKQAGFEPIIFASAGPVDPQLARAGVEVVCLGQHDLLGNPSALAGAAQGIWNFKAAREMKKLLARLPRERTLVHVHGWAKAMSGAFAPAVRAAGLPSVYTFHEYFLFCPNGGFYDYRNHRVCRLQPLSAACWAHHCDSRNYPSKIWRCLRHMGMDHAAGMPKLFSDFIVISDFQAGIVTPRLPPNARVHRISNPIDAENLGRKPAPAAGDFLFVGRLSPEKGLFFFAEAARKANATPVFAGDGPSAAELRARYPEARVLGWKSSAEVKQLMRSARALVFPSLWYEGQPLTVLEAKAAGLPIVISDACAGRDEVDDGETGFWFRSQDADDLADKLERLKDDELIVRMSNAAHDRFWADPPTMARHVARLAAVYEDMMSRRG